MSKLTVIILAKNEEQNIVDCINSAKFADEVLIIDDFLANGQAVQGLIEICHEAHADIVGVGIAIEKSFQEGAELIRNQGVRLESLARISSFADNKVHFVEDADNE